MNLVTIGILWFLYILCAYIVLTIDRRKRGRAGREAVSAIEAAADYL